MANRQLFLHFTPDNDLEWQRQKEYKNKGTAKNVAKQPSALDIKLKNGQIIELSLGDTMKNWDFYTPNRHAYDWPRDNNNSNKYALSINYASDAGQGHTIGRGEFKMDPDGTLRTNSTQTIIFQHIKSKSASIKGGNDGQKFEYDLYIVNKYNGKRTKIIIDPILDNDGLGDEP